MKYSTDDCDCENMKRTKVTRMMRIAGQDILLKNAPARVCPNCGEIYFEGRYLIDLEKEIKRRVEKAA